MAGNPKQKLKLLYIADFMRRNSDEEHPVTTAEIIDYLAEQGVNAERKSVYGDIDTLREYGMPILRTSSPRRGYFLADGQFQHSELAMLIDAVQASPVISQKKTHELTEKLVGMTSVHRAERLRRFGAGAAGNDMYQGMPSKSENEEIYYNIDHIQNAIEHGRKIRFIYHRRMLVNNLPVFDAGREFIISPYAAMWHSDKYYVVGNYEKYDGLSHYRIDRMKKVQCTSLAVRPLCEVSSYEERFDCADYAQKVFNMYAGDEPVWVELLCESYLLEEMIERFGLNVPYRMQADGRFSVKVHVVANEGFRNWILNFGGGVTVRTPSDLREAMKKQLAAMLSAYGG